MTTMTLQPGQLRLNDIRQWWQAPQQLALHDDAKAAIKRSSETIAEVLAAGKVVYGINTGFGLLANTRIPPEKLEDLQRRIVLSHAAGTGALMDDTVVRLMLLLKINSLSRGFSGIRQEVIDALMQLLNAEMYPCVPSKGSVGASGDLAPLAHLVLPLIGEGEVRYQGEIMSARDGLAKIGMQPMTLAPKEGLALLNGTQASTALALHGLFQIERVFHSALVAGAMSVEAAMGSRAPFDARIHEVRGQPGQIAVAASFRQLLGDTSEIAAAHENCEKVQDPYSLRCQPQVMGAVYDQLQHASAILTREANGVTDNPLVFHDNGDIISGGNFHAEPVAMAADILAIAASEIGALSERRSALLIDHHLSNLPPFLVNDGGVNSGFMLAQVTAAALASENKTLAHPASVDSMPTSANQEDHVSMATFAARRLTDIAENVRDIVAIELLEAAQGVDFRRPLKGADKVEQAHALLREKVAYYDQDRFFAPDIAATGALIYSGKLSALVDEGAVFEDA
ncbi:histidine ammonia-lyase [Pseudidiomarina sediminum]|uniref:Histidine ammonia-lyase n=1 Tax=Pseudidiomarina sediminum TaxID=431675 RepID=A0A432Z2W8_9GAMM|nr:histidine ammonia-lyase [Pseudidiomarina sediminum]MBY6064548.1 histidine ammonia-lyase [Pseudidiomarina sediminum]RUO72230.1 histidine ammonia-lyase [Pseudidiomarina sediminum]